LKRCEHFDVRVHLCGEYLLVLGDEAGQDRLLLASSASWLANALREPGVIAFVHCRGSNPVSDAPASIELLANIDEASADSWVVLRRGQLQRVIARPPVDKDCAPFRLSGHQPAYLAYLGYYAKIAAADIFSIAGDMRFGRQTFQHRQRLEDDDGAATWLTVPVVSGRGSGGQPIAAKRIARDTWMNEHLALLHARYRRLPFYETYENTLHQIYRSPWTRVLDLTNVLTRLTAHWLALETTAIMTVEDCRYSGVRRGARIARELSDLMLDAGRDRCQYLAGEAGAKYLLERVPGSDRREIDEIHSAGASVATCTFDQTILTELGLKAGEPAVGLLCAVGPESGSALTEGIVIQPIQADSL
jgi:hypothetical protein